MIISLAAGGGDYLFLVVMLVFGLINWLAGKAKEAKDAKAPPRPPLTGTVRPPRSASRPESADPEAERMRRFMEALGIPPDEAPATPLPPAPRPSAPRPAPVSVPLAPRPLAPPPLPVPEHSLDEADTTTEPVERIHIPELQTPKLPEFETISSRVVADSTGDFVTVTGETSAIPGVSRVAEVPAHLRDFGLGVGTVRAALASRANIRTALVLREILGPPRSMQP